VAQKVWLPIFASMPAAFACRQIMAWALDCGSRVEVRPPQPVAMVRKSGPFASEMPCHHAVEEYLHVYFDGCGLAAEAGPAAIVHLR